MPDYMARAKELSRRSANGEFGMHTHTPAQPCTPACPIFTADQEASQRPTRATSPRSAVESSHACICHMPEHDGATGYYVPGCPVHGEPNVDEAERGS